MFLVSRDRDVLFGAERSVDLDEVSIFGPPVQQDSTHQSPLVPTPPEIPDIELSQSLLLHDKLQHSSPNISSTDLTTSTAGPISVATGRTYAQFLERQDPNRVPSGTPLSARGDRNAYGQYFPAHLRRASNPSSQCRATSTSYTTLLSYKPESSPFKHRRGSTCSTSSSRSSLMFAMHERYVPTSPLSPQPNRQMAPAQPSKRTNHARQSSRNMHMSLPRFHPLAYPHHGSAATPSANTPSPGIAVNGQLRQALSPTTIGRKNREFLDTATAVNSQVTTQNGKPTSPRLEPLLSPRGPVTPLALEIEEAADYFAVKGAGKPSPAGSPGAASSRSDISSGGENPGSGKKKRKADVY